VSAAVIPIDGELKRRLVVAHSERILRGQLADGATAEYATWRAVAYIEATMGAIPADLSADVWAAFKELAVAILDSGDVAPEAQS
jgi:hypothetical protein